nr:hypothetical protein [Tanacetum cinerariifolium]
QADQDNHGPCARRPTDLCPGLGPGGDFLGQPRRGTSRRWQHPCVWSHAGPGTGGHQRRYQSADFLPADGGRTGLNRRAIQGFRRPAQRSSVGSRGTGKGNPGNSCVFSKHEPVPGACLHRCSNHAVSRGALQGLKILFL